MITSEQFKVGEWVTFVGHRFLSGCTGYITHIDTVDEVCRVRITINSRGEYTNGSVWVELDDVIKCFIRDDDDLLTLIDMALDMNDREWFLELTSQLPEALPW